MIPPVLEARDVVVRYGGQPVLSVRELPVSRGETLAVVGPNGAGKSTLLRVLALLEPPPAGTVLFEGRPVSRSGPALVSLRRRLAAVFQTPLLCNTSVAANVAMGLRFRGVPAAVAGQRVRHWAEVFGIAHLLARRPRTLSGGEAQRASLARAFAVDPEVLFLDEPFAALDAPTRASLLRDLRHVLRESRVTTVFVTHDRDEAVALADRMAVMMGGAVEQLGTPEQVLTAPVSAAVARFVGVDNVLPGVVQTRDGPSLAVVAVEGAALRVRCPASAGTRVTVCLRAEDLTVVGPDADAPPTTSVLPGVVRQAVPAGGHLRVEVDAGPLLTVVMSRAEARRLAIGEGQKVKVVLPEAPHVLASAGPGTAPGPTTAGR